MDSFLQWLATAIEIVTFAIDMCPLRWVCVCVCVCSVHPLRSMSAKWHELQMSELPQTPVRYESMVFDWKVTWRSPVTCTASPFTKHTHTRAPPYMAMCRRACMVFSWHSNGFHFCDGRLSTTLSHSHRLDFIIPIKCKFPCKSNLLKLLIQTNFSGYAKSFCMHGIECVCESVNTWELTEILSIIKSIGTYVRIFVCASSLWFGSFEQQQKKSKLFFEFSKLRRKIVEFSQLFSTHCCPKWKQHNKLQRNKLSTAFSLDFHFHLNLSGAFSWRLVFTWPF